MLKENRYQLLPNLISKEHASFLQDYLKIKKAAHIEMRKKNIISEFDQRFGFWGDGQVPGLDTFMLYGDAAFDLTADVVRKKIQTYVDKPLHTTYSYARLYVTGDELKKHVDRASCEVSASINLGGDAWPLYIMSNKEKIKVDLDPGNAVVYYGKELEHWRERFEGKECSQLFIHYSYDSAQEYDKRGALGTPDPTPHAYGGGSAKVYITKGKQ